MSEISRVNVIENTNGDHVELVDDVRQRMVEAGFEVVEDDEVDLLIAVGGDGTYLHHLRDRNYPETPFVGINAGSLGYLQEVELHEIGQLIDDLQSGDYQIAKQGLLRVKNTDSENEVYVFNELTIAGPGPSAANLQVEIEGVQFAKFTGDGFIFSTTQGSTAYNLSAGGSILSPELEAMIITPSNTFEPGSRGAITRPIVLPSNVEVEVTNLDTGRRPVEFYIDGKEYERDVLDPDLPISITKAGRYVHFLRTSQYDFYKRLARKMINIT